uniref:Transmembrane protein n=1 Tax=Steinernema glaseri TaxID=37863 RepID=A0A1I8AKK8_9BILA
MHIPFSNNTSVEVYEMTFIAACVILSFVVSAVTLFTILEVYEMTFIAACVILSFVVSAVTLFTICVTARIRRTAVVHSESQLRDLQLLWHVHNMDKYAII